MTKKEVPSIQSFEPLIKLRKDLKEAAVTLGQHEARFLVDSYYLMQDNRIRADHQLRVLTEDKEPHLILDWLSGNASALERNIAAALGVYSGASPIGNWAESIVGIGPILSAGLISHIDITKAPTAGHIWRFAGLDPTSKWLGREKATALVKEMILETDTGDLENLLLKLCSKTNAKPINLRNQAMKGRMGAPLEKMTKASLTSAVAKRPWNATLKTLCWKIGESFVKVSNNKADVYGHCWRERKEYETNKNENGDYKALADEELKIKTYDKGTEAYKAYIQGKLPDGRIHARAKRYAVKLFLSHWHHVAYELHYKKLPPKPYVIDHLGHTHYLAPPNWPLKGGK